MKRCIFACGSSILIIMLLTSATAQNPKTNAGRLDNKPAGYRPSPVPVPPPQRPVNNAQKDTSRKAISIPGQADQQHEADAVNKNEYGNHVLLGGGFLTGFSQNQFRDVSNGDWGYGFGLSFMYNFMGTETQEKHLVNLHLGLAFEYLFFGGKSSSYTYDDPYPYQAITNKVTTSVNSNMYSLLLASRVEFFTGFIVPFVEVAVGGRLFDGKQKVTYDRSQKPGSSLPSGVTFAATSKNEGTNLQSDIVGTYGYGGGIRIGSPKVKVELKVMYMPGTKARYIDRESVNIDQYTNNVTYQTKTSASDLLIPQLGVSVNF